MKAGVRDARRRVLDMTLDPLRWAEAHMDLLLRVQDTIAETLDPGTEGESDLDGYLRRRATERRLDPLFEPLRESTRTLMKAEIAASLPPRRADWDRLYGWSVAHLMAMRKVQEQTGMLLRGEEPTADPTADLLRDYSTQAWLRLMGARADAEPLFDPLVSSVRQLIGTDPAPAVRRRPWWRRASR